MSSQILIYSGPGAHPGFVKSMQNALEKTVDGRKYSIATINNYTANYACSPDRPTSLLVVPGGNAIKMAEKLHPIKEDISNLIKDRGVAYYGSCAGAIVSSKNYFERTTEGILENDKVVGRLPSLSLYADSSPIDLYPGAVAAPLLKGYQEGKPYPIGLKTDFMEKTRDSAYIECRHAEGMDLKRSYHVHVSGPWFPKYQEYGADLLCEYDAKYRTTVATLPIFRGNLSNRKQEGTYQAEPHLAATILYEGKCPKKEGSYKALLTGLHPEFEPRFFSQEDFTDFGYKKDFLMSTGYEFKVFKEYDAKAFTFNIKKLGIDTML
jgi:glutamine amidotransferase-like uncharacterized protein